LKRKEESKKKVAEGAVKKPPEIVGPFTIPGRNGERKKKII